MRTTWTADDVRAACAELPAPIRHSTIQLKHPRPAAILVPIVDVEGLAAVVVTKRQRGMASHADDWVFPGGSAHPEDTSSAVTAQREAAEELGIPVDAIDVVGQLDTHGPIISGYLVDVYVGMISSGTELRPNPREVADAVILSVAELLAPDRSFLAPMPEHDPGEVAVEAATIQRAGAMVRWYAIKDGEYLWGMQAHILQNLLHHLTAGQHRLS